jgi:hypothetical protein
MKTKDVDMERQFDLWDNRFGGSHTKERYRVQIEEMIASSKEATSRESLVAADGAEIYAYPISEGRIAWGVNAPDTGFNILRGIRRPDGADEAEG